MPVKQTRPNARRRHHRQPQQAIKHRHRLGACTLRPQERHGKGHVADIAHAKHCVARQRETKGMPAKLHTRNWRHR